MIDAVGRHEAVNAAVSEGDGQPAAIASAAGMIR